MHMLNFIDTFSMGVTAVKVSFGHGIFKILLVLRRFQELKSVICDNVWFSKRYFGINLSDCYEISKFRGQFFFKGG